jgi:hypothetical protein
MREKFKTPDLEKDPNIFLSIETSRYLASLCEIDFDKNILYIPAHFSEVERYHAIHYLIFLHTEKDFNQLTIK